MFIDIAKYVTKFGFSSKLTILAKKISTKCIQLNTKKFIAHLIIIWFVKTIFLVFF